MKEKYSISGMSCSACSLGIEKAVTRLDGVQNAEVSLMGECMRIEYDETVLSKEKIIQTVTSLGYGIANYDENALSVKKPQPDKLKKRFVISLAFLLI